MKHFRGGFNPQLLIDLQTKITSQYDEAISIKGEGQLWTAPVALEVTALVDDPNGSISPQLFPVMGGEVGALQKEVIWAEGTTDFSTGGASTALDPISLSLSAGETLWIESTGPGMIRILGNILNP